MKKLTTRRIARWYLNFLAVVTMSALITASIGLLIHSLITKDWPALTIMGVTLFVISVGFALIYANDPIEEEKKPKTPTATTER